MEHKGCADGGNLNNKEKKNGGGEWRNAVRSKGIRDRCYLTRKRREAGLCGRIISVCYVFRVYEFVLVRLSRFIPRGMLEPPLNSIRQGFTVTRTIQKIEKRYRPVQSPVKRRE